MHWSFRSVRAPHFHYSYSSENSHITGYIDHAVKMHELPDEYLADAMPIAKRIALAQGVQDYNILQNNGSIAHQVCLTRHLFYLRTPSQHHRISIWIRTHGAVVGRDACPPPCYSEAACKRRGGSCDRLATVKARDRRTQGYLGRYQGKALV